MLNFYTQLAALGRVESNPIDSIQGATHHATFFARAQDDTPFVRMNGHDIQRLTTTHA